MSHLSPLLPVYLFAAGLAAVVAWRTYHHRHVPGAKPFGVAMTAVSVWAVLSAMIQHPAFQGRVALSLVHRLDWIPVGVIAVAWLSFGLAYTGRDETLTRRRVVALSLVPAFTAVTALSHPYLIPAYDALVGPTPLGGLVDAMVVLGTYWDTVSLVGAAYAYLLLAAGSALVLEPLVERPLPHTGQALLLLVVGPPWALNALQVLVLNLNSFDPTVLGFTVTGVAGLFAIGRFRLFEAPLARSQVVDEMDGGILVYGRDGRVYDYNDRAGAMLDLSTDDLGTDVRRVLADAQPSFDVSPETALFADLGDDGRGTAGLRRGPETASDGGTASLATRLDGHVASTGGADPTYVETRLSDLPNAVGSPVSRVLVLSDVTARERRKRALERSRERYRALFENNQLVFLEFDLSAAKRRVDALAAETDDLVAYLDDNPEDHQWILDAMELQDANSQAVTLYGAPSKAALVENLDRVMTEESVETLKHLWQRLADDKTTFRKECVAQTFAGERRTVLLDMTVLPEFGDPYSQVFITALDITERKEHERELSRRNEYLDEFASVVSHDIATPLGVVENKARLVEMTGETDHVADIFDATDRIRQLTDDLLKLARQGKRVGETEPVSLEAAARRVWQSVDRPGATLVVESTARVEASPERLYQLLENLLGNAVEHGSTGPVPDASTVDAPATVASSDDGRTDASESTGTTTSVEADASTEETDESAATALERVHGDGSHPPADGRDDTVTGGGDDREYAAVTVRVGTLEDGFYVVDDGPGIPEAERDDVFEQGYTTGHDGTGLGLAIVDRIIEAHGWSVGVTDGDAGGARFEVTGATVRDDG